MNPDQTDPSGAVWSVSILLAVVAIEVHQQAIVQMADIFCSLSVIFCVFNDTTNVIMYVKFEFSSSQCFSIHCTIVIPGLFN